MIEIAPSILAADFTRLGQQVSDALACGVKRIHVDVMDGHFVPNISMGPFVVKWIKPLVAKAGAIIETHLMIEEPERYISDFVKAGADLVTVHVETCPHLHRTLQQIRELGAKVGVALNPATPLVLLEEVLDQVDLVLVMTVNPGFGGQEFIPECLDKIARLAKNAHRAQVAASRYRNRRRRSCWYHRRGGHQRRHGRGGRHGRVQQREQRGGKHRRPAQSGGHFMIRQCRAAQR